MVKKIKDTSEGFIEILLYSTTNGKIRWNYIYKMKPFGFPNEK